MFTKHLIITFALASFVLLAAAGGQTAIKNSTVPIAQPALEIVPNSSAVTNTATAVMSIRKTANNEQQCQITKEQFIKAFQALYEKQVPRESIEFIDDGFTIPKTDYYYSGNGGKYILAFVQYYRARGILIVFKNEGSENIPIHMEIFSDILESIRLLPALVGTASLVEVITQDGLGTGRNEQVRLFSMDEKAEPDQAGSFKMSEVWGYRTVTNSARPVAGTKDTYEYSFQYASYIVIPAYFFPIVEAHDTPVIVVNDTLEVFTAQGDDQKTSSDKRITNVQKTFIWDHNLDKFVERA